MPVVPADAPTHAVDDIFARLRASSSEMIARDVLDTGPGAESDAGPDRAPGPQAAGRSADGAADAGSAGDEGQDVRAEALSRRAVALGPVRTTLSRQLKRVLADEQNEVLDRLRQRNASLAPDDVLGSPDEHAGTYREAAEDQLWAAAEHGRPSLSALEGEELHAALESRSVLERCLDTLTTELVVPLRTRLIENLAGCVDGTEAAGAVRATYREWKGRIDELSDDLARTVYGRASYAVLVPGTPICWVVDPTGPGCADAEDNVLAGPVPAGEPFPTGHRYAPAYRGCRCLLVPDRM